MRVSDDGQFGSYEFGRWAKRCVLIWKLVMLKRDIARVKRRRALLEYWLRTAGCSPRGISLTGHQTSFMTGPSCNDWTVFVQAFLALHKGLLFSLITGVSGSLGGESLPLLFVTGTNRPQRSNSILRLPWSNALVYQSPQCAG